MPRVRREDGKCTEVDRLMLGSRLVDGAVSMFEYNRTSPYSGILKDVKYHNSPMIADALARQFGRELADEGFFDGIDIIVPVPLHSGKLAQRGYNQSLFIARGLSAITGIKTMEAIKAVKAHDTQTHRTTSERHDNVKGVFEARQSVAGKCVLVVDDVITTGATTIACCDALQAAGAQKAKVLSLAFAGTI